MPEFKHQTLQYNDPLTGSIIFHFPMEMTNMLQGLLDLITRKEKKEKVRKKEMKEGRKRKKKSYQLGDRTNRLYLYSYI